MNFCSEVNQTIWLFAFVGARHLSTPIKHKGPESSLNTRIVQYTLVPKMGSYVHLSWLQI